MAIERGVDDLDIADLDIQDNSKEIEIDLDSDLDDGSSIDDIFGNLEDDDNEILEDGTMLVGVPPEPMMGEGEDFFENLAELIDDGDLGRIYSDCVADFQDDKSSRKEWEEQYREGLEFLGMKFEERTEPFNGASGIIHPLLAESVTQFQAQAYKELLPAGGPVKTQVVGMMTPNADLQAARVQEFMNYQITQVMKEYDPETDQMLFYLPLSGSAFRKVHFDQSLDRPVSRFIPSEKLVVPYGASSLESATRITHIIDMSLNDVKKMQQSGFYKKSDISYTSNPSYSDDGVSEEIDELQGVKPSGGSGSDECEILEMHIDLDLPGFEDLDEEGEETGIKLPYILTMLPKQSTVLSIRRNYDEKDILRKRIDYFVHYKFLPGLGFYGFGLTHMIGGLSRGATSILRQLIDAGTLANLPGGFKARGIRIRDDDVPIQPGEFRDMDAPGGSLRDALMPLPFKEPSATMVTLLGMLVDAGRRFASIGDMQVGDGNAEAPVGTTVALLERGSRVMSAIHKRLHYSQRIEFNLLAGLFKTYLPPQYPYMTANGDQSIKQSDFDDRIDVLPVSDPNIFSMAQRVTLAQTELQLAQAAPELHNLHEAFRRMYRALGVKDVDSILKPVDQGDPKPKDPATENSDALDSRPLLAFQKQNHAAHIMSHLSFGTSGTVAQMPAIAVALQKHVLEHVSLNAKEQVMAQTMQQLQGRAPSEEDAVQIESMVAEAVSQGMQELKQISAQLSGGNQPDPLIALKEKDLQLQAQRDASDAQIDQSRLTLDQQKAETTARLGAERIQSSEEIVQARIEAARERELMKQQN